MVAANLRYPVLPSPLALLLRLPGATHLRRHVIVHVSNDWVSALEFFDLFFPSMAIDRKCEFSMYWRELHEQDVWCVVEVAL